MRQFFLILFLFAITAISVSYISFTLPELFTGSQPAQVAFVPNLSEKDNLINQVTGFNNQLFANSGADLQSASEGRKEAMFKLARSSPRDFLRLAIDQQTRYQLPAAVRDNIEVETKVRGRLQLMHGDPRLPGELPEWSYSLANDQGLFHLAITGSLPRNYEGAEIEVRGMLLGHTIVVHNGGRGNVNLIQAVFTAVSAPAPPPAILAATGPWRVLVIPINFTDSPVRPFNQATANSLVFSGPTQSFIQEESYGKTSLTGDTLDWLDIPRVHTSEIIYAQINTNTAEVAAYLTANQINLANYRSVVFLINFDFGRSRGSIGGSSYPVSAWINLTNFNTSYNRPFPWTKFDNSLAHELGHNFGVNHADGLDCGMEISTGSCQHQEYGNNFDIMGYGYGALQMNVSYKEKVGWLAPGELLNISQSGRYTINPLENGVGVKGAKIDNGLGRPLYLEYRRGVGFDARISDPPPFSSPSYSSNQNGLMINRFIQSDDNLPFPVDNPPSYPAPRLLDLSPGGSSWNAVTLNGNQTWTDPETLVRIGPIVSSSPNAITFDVTMPVQCQ